MSEQQEYYTFTKDVKTLIQYVQEQAIDHSVVEATNRLNWAIKKNLRDYGIPVIPIKESKDSFEEEKLQYAEDSRAHEKPWELWQWQIRGCTTWSPLLGDDHMWLQDRRYRRKPTTFIPEYFSGLNWKDAEHLVGKIIEYSDFPGQGWKVGKLKKLNKIGENFVVNTKNHCTFYTYIRTISKHPTINIGGVELPMPETVAPANETKYWVFPYPAHRELFHSFHWSGAPSDIDALQAGQVHLTEERAKAWADWWKKEIIAKINEIGS